MNNIEEYDINVKAINDDNIKGKSYIVPPNIEKGFFFGYAIFIPEGCKTDTTLLVHCCNTGGAGITDGKLDRTKPSITLEDGELAAKLQSFSPNEALWCGYDLKMPVLTPLFPRVRGFYTHYLTSKVYNNDVSDLIKINEEWKDYGYLSKEEIIIIKEKLVDLPKQLANMLDNAKDVLTVLGINIDSKVILEGYSASAKFANLFTALHPEKVKACVAGGTSGNIILPMKQLEGQELKFPLGIADVKDFDLESFAKIPQFYFIGDQDNNDPAEVKEIVDGKYIPEYPDCYTTHETTQIHTLLGKTVQERFEKTKEYYEQYGINAKFKKYYGDHVHVIFLQYIKTGKYIVHEKVKSFIKKVLKNEKTKTKSK